MAADEPVAGATEATPLAGLRARREKAKEKLYVDLPVPRMEPPVFVRFGPVDQGKVDDLVERAEKSKDKAHRSFIANASLLAEACLGIFELGADGKPTSVVPDQEEWPKFDEALAAELGVPLTRASDVVRELYLTEGDVAATSVKVLEWNGYAGDLIEEHFSGN